ncbi:MAG: NAD(P)H-dependent oxidoreductase [Candidatus Kapaibacteriales bacterium]
MENSIHIMKEEGIETETIRLIDHDVPPGILKDMTEQGYQKDEWPDINRKIMNADILVVGSPLWLGEKSSVCQKLIERLYSVSGEKNSRGQTGYYGKVAGTIITGNEDGAKHAAMGILYSLSHFGFAIPPQADTSWLGEVGPGPSYGEEGRVGLDNEFTKRNTTILTYNLIHFARMLKDGIPNKGNDTEAWENGERWAFKEQNG